MKLKLELELQLELELEPLLEPHLQQEHSMTGYREVSLDFLDSVVDCSFLQILRDRP